MEIIRDGCGKHFDPDIVDAFETVAGTVNEIARRFSNTELSYPDRSLFELARS